MTSGHHRHSVDQRVDVIATVAAAAAAAATTCVACGGDTGSDFLLRFAPHPRGFDIRPVQSTLPSLNCTQRLSLARKSKVQKGGKQWREDGEKARARASEHKKETLLTVCLPTLALTALALPAICLCWHRPDWSSPPSSAKTLPPAVDVPCAWVTAGITLHGRGGSQEYRLPSLL